MSKAPETSFPGLLKIEREDVVPHRALLLFAMQDPELGSRNGASLRATARALDVSPASPGTWKKRYGWVERLAGHTEEVQREAARLYHAMYHPSVGFQEVDLIIDRMTVPYPKPGQLEKAEYNSERARAKDVHLDRKREEEQSEIRKRRNRLARLADGIENEIAAGLVENQRRRREAEAKGEDYVPFLKVKPSDLIHVVRSRAYLDATAPPSAYERPVGDEGVDGGPDIDLRSERVRQAEEAGEDVIEAMLADARELVAMIEVMRDHEAQSGVIAFPSDRTDREDDESASESAIDA